VYAEFREINKVFTAMNEKINTTRHE
jgi:hypothetical protein